MCRKVELFDKRMVLGVVVPKIIPQMMQFKKLYQHQIEVNPLGRRNLCRVQPALRHLIDLITVQHQVGCAIITRDEFSCPKFTRAGTRPTGFEQRIHTGGFRMNKLLSCRYNMDTNRVEARFADGTTLSIDCIAIEDEYGNTPAQRAELDWLLYNKPLEYAQLVLGGEIEHYLSLGCDHGILED
jgi:hypothetical protein